MPFKHPSKNSAFGRLNDKQQLRRSDIEDFLNAFHAQHNEQRVTEAARASVPEDTYALLEEMNTSPADAITYARDRAAKIRNQSAESRVRGESVVPPMSEREMAQLNARLRKQGIEDAKLAALPVALGAGLVAPIALGASPLVAGLSGATLNAGINAPLNMMDERPEGIGQDTLAGAAMGLASRYHPLAAIPAGIASYAMTNVPEAEAGGWLDNLVKAASERGVRGEVLDRMVGRAKVANQYAPQLFKQHRSDLLSRHLADDSNLLTPIHGKADYDKFLQLASGSRDEGLAGWLASQHDMDRASELGQLRPWHGGPEDRMPNLGVEIYDEGLRAETHGGRHRVLNAYMNGEPTIVEINGYRDNLGPLRGDRVKVWTDDYNSELPIVGHFDTFASGGSVSGTFRRMGQRTMSQAGDVDAVTAPRGALSVIKNKGGNWLTGSVEGALSGLKKGTEAEAVNALRRVRPEISEQQAREFIRANQPGTREEAALNSFIDKQLTRYVKNEMATPEDPVRALAERGVLHVDPNTIPIRNLVHPSGEETRKLGVSEAAKRWENRSDRAIAFNPASDYQDFGHSNMTREHPWVAKLDPTTPMYRYNTGISTQDLGFDHLIDELSNALNPESGLPRHLLLDPKSIDRVSVPQAVERVSQINAWRAAQKAEADAARANNAATVLHKDYPDKGFKWVELKAQQEADRAALQDALKYEGDTMGHCVGGYCDDVAAGRSRIYSLRDAKGQPHVTIEVAPQAEDFERSVARRELLPEEFAKRYPDELPPRIVQIKGKANRAPNPEYLPFVQDFVRSGKWSDVGDLQNSGLLDISKLKGGYSLGMRDADYQILGDALRKRDPNMRSVSQTLADALPPDAANYMTREELFRYLGVEGFAHGGPVQTKPFSISDLQAIIASLRQEHSNA